MRVIATLAATAALTLGGCATAEAPAPACATITDTGASTMYAEHAPRCDDGTLTVTDAELPEDAYGWNCWTDGNADCGDALTTTATDCLTDTRDGYTMCRDGRVYILRDGHATGVVVRVTGAGA